LLSSTKGQSIIVETHPGNCIPDFYTLLQI